MLLQRILLTTIAATGLGLLPGFAQAQRFNHDATRATQARDSVLLTVNQYRQNIEQQATQFKVSTRFLGVRRRVTRGYAPKSTDVSAHPLAWKHVTRSLRTGTTRERYIGYIDGVKVLQESRTNERLNYVRLHRIVRAGSTIIGRKPLGQLTREGYIQWGDRLYVLTTPTKL